MKYMIEATFPDGSRDLIETNCHDLLHIALEAAENTWRIQGKGQPIKAKVTLLKKQ